ncbi:MAG: sulfurtransferase TusA [Pseudomonadota bacterium]
MKHDHELDTRGLRCPEPVMLLHACLRRAKAGEVIRLMADDPATQRDIPALCSNLGHTLLDSTESDGVWCYFVRKRD